MDVSRETFLDIELQFQCANQLLMFHVKLFIRR